MARGHLGTALMVVCPNVDEVGIDGEGCGERVPVSGVPCRFKSGDEGFNSGAVG